MTYRRLYIWVEGVDDDEFFSRIIQPYFDQAYDLITIVQYAERSKRWMKAYFTSIHAMKADYLFIADLNGFTCVTRRLDEIEKVYPFCQRKKAQIVVKEIEGWYTAGLIDNDYQQLNVKPVGNCNTLTKEQFNTLVPDKFDSRRAFMNELLKRFSVQTAVSKNKSFRYFVEKYNLEASA